MKPEHTTEQDEAIAAFHDEPMEIVRCLAGVAAQRRKMRPAELRDEPDPLADWSPLVQAAKRLCIAHGYAEDGGELAVRVEFDRKGGVKTWQQRAWEDGYSTDERPKPEHCTDEMEEEIRDLRWSLARAEGALLRSGFQDLGGQEWGPPICAAPRFIEVAPAPLPPEQIADLATRCGVKASASALAEFVCLTRDAQPLAPEEMRPAPIASQDEATPTTPGKLTPERIDAIMVKAFPRTKPTPAYREFALDIAAMVLEDAAETLDAMNESSGDAAAYDGREMYTHEQEREDAISACAKAVRALKPFNHQQ